MTIGEARVESDQFAASCRPAISAKVSMRIERRPPIYAGR
jgi:hypothetical protein